MKLRAIMFGAGTFVDVQKVECAAYNRVFAEAGLPWDLDEEGYRRLRQLSSGDEDMLATFAHHAGWRDTDDLRHLLRVVRRRYETVGRELAEDPAFVDAGMLSMAQEAEQAGLQLATLGASPAIVLTPALRHADTHAQALRLLNLAATAVLAIEQTPTGIEEAKEANVVAVAKSALLKELAAIVPPTEQGTMAILTRLHARSTVIDLSFRRSLMALSA